MKSKKGIFARVREFQPECWDIHAQTEDYKRDIVNWERIYFTRKVSVWLTYCLRNTRITPNQVTGTWVLLGVAGAVALVCPDYRVRILALLALSMSWILDNVDGELARCKQQFSISGSLLDMVGHGIFFPLIFAGITLSMALGGTDVRLVALGVLAAALVTPFLKMQENVKLLLCLRALSQGDRLVFSMQEDDGTTDMSAEPGHMSGLLRKVFAVTFNEVGMFYLLILAVLLRYEHLFVMFYGVGISLLFIPKYRVRSRELRRIAEDPKHLKSLFRPEWLDS